MYSFCGTHSLQNLISKRNILNGATLPMTFKHERKIIWLQQLVRVQHGKYSIAFLS